MAGGPDASSAEPGGAAGTPAGDEEAFVRALGTLGPQGRLPGQLLYATSALEAAGIDVEALATWAAAHGGGPLQAGAVKVRKGQRPEQGRVGRPEGFIGVPDHLIR
ncbi:MAG: hypothetical protein PGN13_14365 [Patulibacter minatonensis]